MNTVVKIAGIVVVALALIVAGFFIGTQVVSAQAAANPDAPAFGPGGGYGPGGNFGQGGPGMGRHGMRGGGPGDGLLADYHDQMHAAVAEALGITTDELDQAIQSGQTPWQIAQDKGIDADQFREAMLQARADVLAQAVKDGKLTQEQADAMLERMQEHMGQGFGQGFGPNP